MQKSLNMLNELIEVLEVKDRAEAIANKETGHSWTLEQLYNLRQLMHQEIAQPREKLDFKPYGKNGF